MPFPEDAGQDPALVPPATVRSPITGPQQLSDAEVDALIEVEDLTAAPADPSEPQPGADEEASGQQEQNSKTFDPQYRQPFFGLLHLGALDDEFYWLGHKFNIRTLTTEELLVVGLLTKDYEDTLGASVAYTAAMVAMATQLVDGQPLPESIKEERAIERGRRRFQYVIQWYKPTIDAVYGKFLALDQVVSTVVQQMGNS